MIILPLKVEKNAGYSKVIGNEFSCTADHETAAYIVAAVNLLPELTKKLDVLAARALMQSMNVDNETMAVLEKAHKALKAAGWRG